MTAYCYDATYYVISNLCAHSDYTTYSVPRQLLDNGYSAMNLVVDGYGTTAGVTGALNLSYGMVGAGDYQVPGTVTCGPGLFGMHDKRVRSRSLTICAPLSSLWLMLL